MELKYRGMTYTKTVSELRVKHNQVTGKYRGTSCQIAQVELPFSQRKDRTFKYRGASYNNGYKSLSAQQELASMFNIYKELIHS